MIKQIIKKLITSLIPQSMYLDLMQRPIIRRQEAVSRQCKADVDRLLMGEIPDVVLHAKRPELVGKPIIWQYWGQGVEGVELPEVVSISFASVDRYREGFEVIRLSDESISDYIDVPAFVFDKMRDNPQFRRTFFSDLLRLALLDVYGGVWLDATVLLTAPLPKEYISLPFFAFQRDPKAEDQNYWRSTYYSYFGWQKGFRARFLSSILFAKPGQPIVHAFLRLILNYWKTREEIEEYFFFQIYFQELIEGPLKSENCPIVSDTLPHIFSTLINGGDYKRYSYEDVPRVCPIQKLSYFREEVRPELLRALKAVGLSELIKS